MTLVIIVNKIKKRHVIPKSGEQQQREKRVQRKIISPPQSTQHSELKSVYTKGMQVVKETS